VDVRDSSAEPEFEGEDGGDQDEGIVVVAVVVVVVLGCKYVLGNGLPTVEEAGDVKTVEAVDGDEKIFDDGVEREVVREVGKPFFAA
jgi:hypothetical protein